MAEDNTPKPILSGLIRRFFAGFIDFFILLGLATQIFGLSFSISSGFNVTGTEFICYKIGNAILFYLILLMYFGVLEGTLGYTLGKFVLREKVVSTQGSKPSLYQTLIRNLFKPIEFLLNFVPLFLSNKNQTLGDRIAKTIVIRRTNVVPEIIPNASVNIFRKALGILLGISVLLNIVLTILSFPKIQTVSFVSENYFFQLKNGLNSGNIAYIYNASSARLKEQQTLNQLQNDISQETELKDAITNASRISFYQWKFQDSIACSWGETDKNQKIRIILSNESNEWKFLSITLLSEP
jgi:uncharacterized RDD family membrane protein YckC